MMVAEGFDEESLNIAWINNLPFMLRDFCDFICN